MWPKIDLGTLDGNWLYIPEIVKAKYIYRHFACQDYQRHGLTQESVS
jgi:hypothetical protein